MSPTRIAEFGAATRAFMASHRNCPVEITISDLDHVADSGILRRMEFVREPDGGARLKIVLRRGNRISSVRIISRIRSINVTDRRLSVDSGMGIHQNLECLALHNAEGREKLLLIRHLAAIAEA